MNTFLLLYTYTEYTIRLKEDRELVLVLIINNSIK